MTMDSSLNTTNKSSDVSKLISMGFDRERSIQALNDSGSLDGAIVSLTSGCGTDIEGSSQSRTDDDPPLKLIDDHDKEHKVPLTTASMVENARDFDAAIGNSHLTPNQYNNAAAAAPLQPLLNADRDVWDIDTAITNSHLTPNQYNNAAADAPSQPRLSVARVEQIEDNRGPEPPISMLPHFQNSSKKLSTLTARVEQVEDNDGPELPIAMISRFQDDDKKKRAFPDNSKSSNSIREGGEDELARQWNSNILSPRQIGDVDPTVRSGPAGELVNNDAADEEKSGSVDSKSDTDQQEECVAIIPEAFLVEEEVEGEVIQATLIEPTPPWWKMRQAQLMFCFVIILVLALSISLGIDNNKNKAGTGSMSPSVVANVLSSPSPTPAPSCSLDSDCGASLEIWTNIAGTSISELRLYTNGLRSEPNETKRLFNMLEAPSNFGEYFGSRIKGWLTPPVTGNYTFWVASDDHSEFWMSTDDDPRNVELLCYLYERVASRDWLSHSMQESVPVWLATDKSYYFQALLKQGVSLDHLAVAWKYPGQEELQVIPAEYSRISGPTAYDEEIIPVDSLVSTNSSPYEVNCSIDAQCGAILKTWTGIEGMSAVAETNFFEDMPNKTERLWELLEIASNEDENYGDAMEGWLVPPVTGDYTFWIASDYNGELFFNQNYGIGYVDNALHMICKTPDYSGVREWNKSDEQKSTPIPLVKGQPYFFQIRRKQGVNENHLAVAWEYPGQTREVIPAMYSRTTSLAFSCLDCGASLETWKGIDGWSTDDLRRGTENFLLAPSYTDRLWTLLESQSNFGEFLGQRMRGWLKPPVTGNYTFWISADDQGELWLSTDDNPENVFLACKVPAATPSREWKWFYHQQSSPINLVAGEAYYFEALVKQGTAQHYLVIAWRYPGQEFEVIPAKYSRITNPSTCRDSNCGAILTTWTGISGLTIGDLMAGTNDYEKTSKRTDRLKSLLEIVPDQGENYGVRIEGWLLPPVSCNYTFLLASDDASEFWLSTDDDPANKDLECNCSSAVGYREWDKIPGQVSRRIPLVHGQSYYFEVLMKEGRERDHLAIAWECPGQYREVIPAKFSRTTRPN